MARRLGLATVLGLLQGCSEIDPPTDPEWKPTILAGVKVAFTGLASSSPTDALAVGFDLPERSLLYRAVAGRWTGGRWTVTLVPGHEGESFQLQDAARAADGSVWACGAVQSLPEDPSTARAVVYRWANDSWNEIVLAGLEAATAGVTLEAIATRGRDSSLEIRTVGRRTDGTGAAFRWYGGAWSAAVVPPLPTGPWTLTAVGCTPQGIWYAAGERLGGPGGAVYVDRGAGWEALAGPAIEDLSFTALAFDENDIPHFTANRVVGDGFEGLIFRLVRGQFEALPIERLTSGWSRLQAIGFDVVGHGWVAGGHAPDDPYLAGNLSGRWIETPAEAEIEGEAPPPGEEEETGGELYAVDVFERFAGLAVGQAEESGPEGYVEYLPRILQLFPRPVGEIDLRSDPVAPTR